MGPLDSLREGYARALEEYLRRHDEEHLSAGYDLGRRALAEGLGLLDTTSVHQEVIDRIAAREAFDREQLERDGWRFLQEVISSYEMTLHGYREANAELGRLNEALRKQAAQLEAANQDLEAFSYSVAHDLRAPVRRMDGFARALEEDCGDVLTDMGKRYLDKIHDSARRMNGLIDDLLVLGKVSRNELKRMQVDLSGLATRIAGQLSADDPAREVEVTIQPGVVASCDPGLLENVLVNLLGNAWKFTAKRARAEIAFRSFQRDGQPVYAVEDNGVGFAMADAPRLFQPFQRLHAGFIGSGIGLAIVERIIKRHGGRVWALSEPDRGARFFFTLPPEPR